MCPTIRPVTDLNPGAMNALVQLMTGQANYEQLDEDALLAILAMCADGRTARYRAATRLNDSGKTFAQIVDLLKQKYDVTVHEATVARWAKRPDVDRRRRRSAE